MKVDRGLLLKPVEISSQTSSSLTIRQTTPVLIGQPTEIPDSVERPMSEIAGNTEIEMETPPPITKKVVKPRIRQTTNTQVDLFNDFFTSTTPIKQSPRKY